MSIWAYYINVKLIKINQAFLLIRLHRQYVLNTDIS